MKMFKSLALVTLLAAAVYCRTSSAPPIKQFNSLNQASTLVTGVASRSNPESCETPSGQTGECVRYFQCNENSTIIKDGLALIDIRSGERECSSYLDICCLDPLNEPTLPSAEKPEYSCGVRNINGVGFRTTGDVNNESKFGEFPYMVAILKTVLIDDKDPNSRNLNLYVGGGSLIHPSIVLTAAHTVATTSQLRIRAGEWDTQTMKEIYLHQNRDVKEVVIHNRYNRGNLYYDIALLFLTKPVDPAPHIGVACLPRLYEGPENNERCQTSGWGKNMFGNEGQYQVILKRVGVPIVDPYTCQEQLRNTRLGWYFMLHSSFICAGGEAGKDACIGDGGSPLVCPTKNERDRYVQYGIVAWGIGCGEADIPGVYVDVAFFRDWIDEKVIAHGYDPNVYTY